MDQKKIEDGPKEIEDGSMTLIRIPMSKDGLSRFPIAKDGLRRSRMDQRRLKMEWIDEDLNY